METHAHVISTHPHHNDQLAMPHANEMSLHTTQSIGPIKLLLPTTICFCFLLFNIVQILQANCLAEPRIVLHRLGNESDTIEERFALDGHPFAIQIVAYFLKHDFIKLFQPQHNGDSTYKSKQRQQANFSILDTKFLLLPRLKAINDCITSRLICDFIKH